MSPREHDHDGKAEAHDGGEEVAPEAPPRERVRFHHDDADDRGEDRKRALRREALAEPKPSEHRGDKGRRGLEDENVRDRGLLERDDEAHHRRAEGHGNAERRKAKPAEGAERASPIAQRDVDEEEERREQRTPKERREGIGRRRARDEPGGAPGGRRAGDEKRAAAISCRRLRSRFGKGIDELRHFGQPGSLSSLARGARRRRAIAISLEPSLRRSAVADARNPARDHRHNNSDHNIAPPAKRDGFVSTHRLHSFKPSPSKRRGRMSRADQPMRWWISVTLTNECLSYE